MKDFRRIIRTFIGLGEIDSRWAIVPILSVLAYTIGNVSGWIILLIIFSIIKIKIKF